MSEHVEVQKPDADQSFPLSQKFNINFSALEDRLVMRAERMAAEPVTLLFTRRMTLLVLQQVISRLPDLSELAKTPTAYWQDVLQMAHQQAMQAKTTADSAAAREKAENPPATDPLPGIDKAARPQDIYLATELTVQSANKRLTLAFRGLPMPEAMTTPSRHAPLLAIPLTVDNVHQLIELLIAKAQEAQWHLPVDLPWLNSVPADSAGKSMN